MKKKIAFCFFSLIFSGMMLNAQNIQNTESNDNPQKLSFSFNSDLVSRFIWRGLPLSLSPNIQPYITTSFHNFTLEAWGSYSLSSQYAETDLSLTYDLGPFTLGLNDYYNEDENDMSVSDYFNFRNTKDSTGTPHSFEGYILFNGTEGFPVSLTVATFFYGNDKNDDYKNMFSTYLEASYSFSFSDNDINLFVGGTTGKSCYAEKAAVVNTGITASREIKISDSWSLPVSTSFIVNPSARDVFFVMGLTF